MRSIFYTLSAAIFVGFAPTVALSCNPDAPPPSEEDFSSLEQTVLNSESVLSRISAYNRLLSVKDPSLRDEIIRIGLTSGVEGLQGAALRCKLMHSTLLRVEPGSLNDALQVTPDMPETLKNRFDRVKPLTYSIYFVDPARSCASINGHTKDDCKPDHSALVSGQNLSFKDGRPHNGSFKVDQSGRLMGTLNVFLGDGHYPVPAEAFLE